MNTPDALLFDMDGLLLDSERVAFHSFLDVTGPRGIERAQAEPFFLTLVGTSTAITRQRVDEFLTSNHDRDVFAQDWSAAFKARLAKGVPLKPGVAEVLGELSDMGMCMAVVTSTYGDSARDHLDRAGIIHHFEHVTGGDEVSKNKPNPEPYLETAAKLGVNAADCAAFEDSDRGITAAVAAGCRAVQIPDLRPLDQPFPDLGQLMANDFRHAMELIGLISSISLRKIT